MLVDRRKRMKREFEVGEVVKDKSKSGGKERMDRLVKLVEKWSKDRYLHKVDSSKQFLKVSEEVGEVASALAKGKPEELKDGIGDVIVTLIILAQQQGLSVEECLEHAYNEIKNREGKLVNGVFIKAEDL